MTEPRPMSAVVEGLPTKSAKIKALIAEGYLRTDVARFLSINYQHVRKVLEDAGIRDGLQIGASPDAPKPRRDRERMEVQLLVDAGFIRLGLWTSIEGRIQLETAAPRIPGVYAFVIAGQVIYRSGHSTQKTSSRINLQIIEELAAGRVVEIYLATPEPAEWNGLPVNMAAGLEEGLIQKFRPPWNVRSATG
ncbi:GIY-YIG nuclease family protein [Mesorhizobium sp. M0118]|uniref:GIY-YIG nuclease family protein n=1 Tax=Mesorhizobium sp. M0118 TaxID=2956884 RepID=UPI0033396590